MSERDPFGPLESPEWAAYVSTPNGAALGRVLSVTTIQQRPEITRAVEELFFERQNWRVAQQAALLHLDWFAPHAEVRDLVKALFFADRACVLSKDDSRSRLVMARVSWERRLPLAVLHDVQVAYTGRGRLESEVGLVVADRILADAFLLEGLAWAYLEDVTVAHERLLDAEGHGGLTVEGVLQLLLAAEPTFPDVSMWAASRLPPGIALGGRIAHLHLLARRRLLLRLLLTRSQHV